MKKPWIVYKRMLGFHRVVARYAHQANARARVRGSHPMENLGVIYEPSMSESMRRAMGVRTRRSR